MLVCSETACTYYYTVVRRHVWSATCEIGPLSVLRAVGPSVRTSPSLKDVSCLLRGSRLERTPEAVTIHVRLNWTLFTPTSDAGVQIREGTMLVFLTQVAGKDDRETGSRASRHVQPLHDVRRGR